MHEFFNDYEMAIKVIFILITIIFNISVLFKKYQGNSYIKKNTYLKLYTCIAMESIVFILFGMFTNNVGFSILGVLFIMQIVLIWSQKSR